MSVTPARDKTKPRGPDGKYPIIPNVFDVKVYGRVTTPGERPKPTCRRVTGRRAADRLEAQLKADRDRGLQLDPSMTLAAYTEQWLEVTRPAVARRTFENYETRLRRYVLPALGGMRLASIRAMHIRRLYADLEARGLSGTSRQDVHRTLRRVFAAAAFDGLIHPSADPMRKGPGGINPPPNDTAEVVPLAPEEQARLLTMLAGTTVYAPAVVMLAAGLRRQEVLALRWQDVDLDGGTVTVTSAVEQVGSEVALKVPKSARSRRCVPIGADVVAVLKAHKAEQAATKLRLGCGYADEGLVFPSYEVSPGGFLAGRIWSPNAFSHAWRKALAAGNQKAKEQWIKDGEEEAAYEPLEAHPHQLRHTYATGLLMRCRHVEEVSRLLGHANSAITARVYSHWLPQDERVEAEVPLPSSTAT